MSPSDTPVSMLSGAASGIGRHMAEVLARQGHRLVLLDIDQAGLTGVAEQLGLSAERALVRRLDVRDAAGWQAVVEECVERFGRLDTMLNIAGFLRPGNLVDVSAELLSQHIDVNTKGAMIATWAGARQMVKQGSGQIINVASIAALSHVPGLAAYAASKHAVRGFSLSVAHELRPRGVFVSVLCPDAVETPMLTLQEDYAEARMTFGARRALSVGEVEAAILRIMRTHELEVVLDVPLSGRAQAAKLANMFPRLTRMAHRFISARGGAVQRARLDAKARA
ncbi:MAG: SDR family oxidoreductase [Myxococcales bacterium]